MECEMCGKKVGTRRYRVDGSVMNLGMCCAKYGTLIDVATPPPAGTKESMQRGLERRAVRQSSRDVYAQETWDLVSDYGRRILQARERRGWTRDQLGNKVSARVPELTKIEANQLRPSDTLAKALEKELGITLLEKIDAGPAAVSGVAKPASGKGLTIGDLLKDAMDKK